MNDEDYDYWFDAIRQTCGNCEHPVCAATVKTFRKKVESRDQQIADRAYKQGWDSAGGELIKNKAEIEQIALAARREGFADGWCAAYPTDKREDALRRHDLWQEQIAALKQPQGNTLNEGNKHA